MGAGWVSQAGLISPRLLRGSSTRSTASRTSCPAHAAAHLLSIAEDFDLVWASGWEEKAEEYLPRLLGLPAGLPFLRFERSQGAGRSINGHWKLDAIDTYAGTRPLAWIDDAFDESCHTWAAARPAPTLLVQSAPTRGLTATEAQQLTNWAQALLVT